MFSLLLFLSLAGLAQCKWPSALTLMVANPSKRTAYWIAGAEDERVRASLNYDQTSLFLDSHNTWGPSSVSASRELDDTLHVTLPTSEYAYAVSKYFRGTSLNLCTRELTGHTVGEIMQAANAKLDGAIFAYQRHTDPTDGNPELHLEYALENAACALLLYSNVNAKVFAHSFWNNAPLSHIGYPNKLGFTAIAFEEGSFSGHVDYDFNDYVALTRLVHSYVVDGKDTYYVGSTVSHLPRARGSVSDAGLYLIKDQTTPVRAIEEIKSKYTSLSDNFQPLDGSDNDALFSSLSGTTVFSFSGGDTPLAYEHVPSSRVSVYLGAPKELLPAHSGVPVLHPSKRFANVLTTAGIPYVYATTNHTVFISNDHADYHYQPRLDHSVATGGYAGMRFVLIAQPTQVQGIEYSQRARQTIPVGHVLNLMNVDQYQVETTLASKFQGATSSPVSGVFRWTKEGFPLDNHKIGQICVNSAVNVGQKCKSSRCAYGFCSEENVCMGSNGTHAKIGENNVDECNVIDDSFCKFGICYGDTAPYYGFFSFASDCMETVSTTPPSFCKEINDPLNSKPASTETLYPNTQ
jgi:hypothetical protein